MRRKQIVVLSLMVLIFLFAVAGVLAYFEHLEYPEALYRTVYISLTHHDNFHMETWVARLLIIVVVLASLVLIAYLLKLFGEDIIGLGDGLKRSKVKTKLLNMKDHYIVCGLGRVGSQVA